MSSIADRWPRPRPDAVFFDLDGTLADTAHDLSAPINAMRIEQGLAPLELADLRPFASMGARGLIGRGLGVANTDPRFADLRDEFLRRYEQAMVVHTRLFDGMPQLLQKLEEAVIRWGVVSNKVERYVRRILDELELGGRSAVAIGGDTTGHPKPRPEPLLLAARLTGVAPARCVYVGDDQRDVAAAHAAGMAAVAAAYGYSGDESPPAAWGADALIETPQRLLDLLMTG